MVKKGDTLIEVMLAIGIFSMVAISIVAVMTGGMSNAQNALETTLAREEIDTQAESLRFIHAAYIADEGSDANYFTRLWEKITNNAYDPKDNTSTDNQKYQQYNPSSCQEIYNPASVGILNNKAFVINPYALADLSKLSASSNTTAINNAINKAYVSYPNSGSNRPEPFRQASTYPHLVYATDTLTGSSSNLTGVEGIYVLAVKDPGSTTVVGSGKKAAYYDFYIRACWYGTGSDTPSTISTVIRLYDPKGIEKK